MIIGWDDLILVTGANGFIGSRVVEGLLDLGFRNLRCFVRPSNAMSRCEAQFRAREGVRIEVVKGNLLSREDCIAAMKGATVIFHLAASKNADSFPEAYMNSVVTTRNLLEASLRHQCLQRFVNVSSFSVYANTGKSHHRLLDESCPVETHPELRGEPYCFAKVKQDELLVENCRKFGIPYVIVRPGCVYGPGDETINRRVGLGTFGIFLHLGGSNRIPFTYVDNCAEAIVMTGLKEGVEGEVFNVVDDDLPTSRQFLSMYRRNVRTFRSLYVPGPVSFALCYLWEQYSIWSEGQLPPSFNRKTWHAYWKNLQYSNAKLKTQVGWAPKVSMAEGFRQYVEGSRSEKQHA